MSDRGNQRKWGGCLCLQSQGQSVLAGKAAQQQQEQETVGHCGLFASAVKKQKVMNLRA